MAYIVPRHRFTTINVEVTARQYVIDGLNVARRASVQSEGIDIVKQLVEHGLSRIPRVLATKALPISAMYNVRAVHGSNSQSELIASFCMHDDRDNYRNVVASIIHGPITIETDACATPHTNHAYVFAGVGADAYYHNAIVVDLTPSVVVDFASVTSENHYYEHSSLAIDANLASAPTNATATMQLMATNCFRPYGYVVSERPLDGIDTAYHRHVNTFIASGETIIDADLESLYDGFYALRTRGLKTLFAWSADREGVEVGPTAHPYGILVASNVYRNLFDNASTDRTANTPGFSCPVYAAGIGNPATESGRKVKVACWARGISTSAPATFKFVGPNSFVNNWTEFTVANTGSIASNGGTGFFVYLDSSVNYAENSVNRNKIDVFCKTSTGSFLVKSTSAQMITDYEGY